MVIGGLAQPQWYIWPKNGSLASDPHDDFQGGGTLHCFCLRVPKT